MVSANLPPRFSRLPAQFLKILDAVRRKRQLLQPPVVVFTKVAGHGFAVEECAIANSGEVLDRTGR